MKRLTFDLGMLQACFTSVCSVESRCCGIDQVTGVVEEDVFSPSVW